MSAREIEIAGLLARCACALRHGHYARALVRLNAALACILAGELSDDVRERASRLCEALAVIAMARTAVEAEHGRFVLELR